MAIYCKSQWLNKMFVIETHICRSGDSSSLGKRGRGRPRKRKFVSKKADDERLVSSSLTFTLTFVFACFAVNCNIRRKGEVACCHYIHRRRCVNIKTWDLVRFFHSVVLSLSPFSFIFIYISFLRKAGSALLFTLS